MSLRLVFEFGTSDSLVVNVGPEDTFDSIRSRFYTDTVTFRTQLPPDPEDLFLRTSSDDKALATTHKLRLLVSFFATSTFRLSTRLIVPHLTINGVASSFGVSPGFSGAQVHTDSLATVVAHLSAVDSNIRDFDTADPNIVFSMGAGYQLDGTDSMSRFLEEILRRGRSLELTVGFKSTTSTFESTSASAATCLHSLLTTVQSPKKLLLGSISMAIVLLTVFLTSTSSQEGAARVAMAVVSMAVTGAPVLPSESFMFRSSPGSYNDEVALMPSVFSSEPINE
jgi:hypothetical protein